MAEVAQLDPTLVDRNRQLQRDRFGRTLFEIFRRARNVLLMTQQDIAERVGLSQPMISQLASGRRGLPTSSEVLFKLEELRDAAPPQVRLGDAALPVDMAAIGKGVERTLAPLSARGPLRAHRTAAATVHRALTDLASPPELSEAAQRISQVAPGLAALLGDLATLSRQEFLTRHATMDD